jgi:hypothetical protein
MSIPFSIQEIRELRLASLFKVPRTDQTAPINTAAAASYTDLDLINIYHGQNKYYFLL